MKDRMATNFSLSRHTTGGPHHKWSAENAFQEVILVYWSGTHDELSSPFFTVSATLHFKKFSTNWWHFWLHTARSFVTGFSVGGVGMRVFNEANPPPCFFHLWAIITDVNFTAQSHFFYQFIPNLPPPKSIASFRPLTAHRSACSQSLVLFTRTRAKQSNACYLELNSNEGQLQLENSFFHSSLARRNHSTRHASRNEIWLVEGRKVLGWLII